MFFIMLFWFVNEMLTIKGKTLQTKDAQPYHYIYMPLVLPIWLMSSDTTLPCKSKTTFLAMGEGGAVFSGHTILLDDKASLIPSMAYWL